MKNSHGETLFVPVSLGVPQLALAQSWSVGQSKFRTASLSCRIGSWSADLCFTQYVWLVPRSGGCRVYWDMPQVFRSMLPSRAGGLPSAWLKDKRQPWRTLASSCLSGGKHCCDSTGTDNGEWLDRCLPPLSVSTSLLEVLPFMWQYGHKAAGVQRGVRQERCTQIQ